MIHLPSLINQIVCPCVEYENLIWGPFFIADCNKIESIQWKATRMVSNIRNLEYQERLKVLKLSSLKYQRYRGDMITLYNLMHSNYAVADLGFSKGGFWFCKSSAQN